MQYLKTLDKSHSVAHSPSASASPIPPALQTMAASVGTGALPRPPPPCPPSLPGCRTGPPSPSLLVPLRKLSPRVAAHRLAVAGVAPRTAQGRVRVGAGEKGESVDVLPNGEWAQELLDAQL